MGTVTPSLEDAVSKAAALPPREQDELAALILAEIEDEQQWRHVLSDRRSAPLLERLAAEAAAEDDAGLTQPLDALLASGDREIQHPTDTRE